MIDEEEFSRWRQEADGAKAPRPGLLLQQLWRSRPTFRLQVAAERS